MRRTTGLSVVILIVLISLPAAALAAAWGKGYLAPEAAAPQAVYTLSWWTVDGGGTTFNAQEGYRLGGTIGQPDAAVWSGGGYTLAAGFWGGAAAAYPVYMPLVLRD